MGSKLTGNYGEDYAIRLLKQNAYRVLTRNFRTRFGEIDIIAIQNEVLVLVEVKTRISKKFGFPQEAVTPRKLATIAKVGEYYSMLHPDLPKKMRIDVVAIQMDNQKIVSAKIIPAI